MAARRKTTKTKKQIQAVAPKPKIPSRPKLSAALRLEAHALAFELLAQCQTDRTIKEALKMQFHITQSVATSILRGAEKAMKAPIDSTAPAKRAQMKRRLEALYRSAHAQKKLTVCATVLRQLTDLEGLNEPIKVDVHDSREFGAGRSVEDLNFYAEHGAWPEEMPDAKPIETITTTGDPLAQLPPVVH